METNDILRGIESDLFFSFRKKMPVILQTEVAECGLACLAMIAKWYGYDNDLMSLRHQFGVSTRGVSLENLVNIASQIGMASRPLSMDIDELDRIRLPCILHWDFNHFVVLARCYKGSFIIHDPASGKIKISHEELSKHFTGIALELWAEKKFKKTKEQEKLNTWNLACNISGLRKSLIIIFLFSLMIEFINLLLPIATQMAMDNVLPSDDYSLLILICFSLLFLTLLQAGLSIFRNRILIITNTLTDIQWKDGLFRHLLALPLSWFEKRYVGDIHSRFNSLDSIRSTITRNMTSSMTNIVMIMGSLLLMSLYGGWLTIIVLFMTLIYTFIRLLTYPIYRQASEELIIKNARASSSFTETLFGISSVRSQGIESQRRDNWLSHVSESVNTGFKIARIDVFFNVLSSFVGACDNVIILWIGISLVMNHSMTVGEFIAFTSFRSLFSDRVLSLTEMLLQLKMLSLHNNRVADIALYPCEKNKINPLKFNKKNALSIRTENLTFSYDTQSPPILNSIFISVAAGECVAIIGKSGCGKSTLMKLLAGLNNPGRGCIKIEGVDINHIGLQNYRKHIACILQDDRLFSGSLKDNITGFTNQPDEEWLRECAKIANIHNEIELMPMGYDTLTGELGEGLSGGQRQRIFIARALYSRPGILFMDEATSHLDEDNELLINEAISSLSITRVIIAHRPSTIASANRIIDLTNLSN